MNVVKMPLSTLKRPERNVRMHTEKQLKEFERSVSMFGQIRPIVVDDERTILAGNGLYETLLRMGWEEADVLQMKGLTENQKKKLMLADNKIFGLGVDDLDSFDAFLIDLKDDLDIPGFDEDLLRSMVSQAGEVTEKLQEYGTLDADEIEEITGILNGTTNYMMSKMYNENADYDAVLKEAQAMGYAERDPSADVEGYDACRKIAILSSIISGKQVDFEDIYTEGITEVTLEDIQYAKAMDMKIKLLASCKRSGEKLCAIVAPHLVSKSHPLYNIEDVFNAIFVKGNMLGDSMFYGSGAGKLPTASAVVGDIVEAAKNPNRSMMSVWDAEKLELEEKCETTKRFFVRIKGTEEVLKAELENVFGNIQIVKLADVTDEFGFITEVMSEGRYEACAKQFAQICHMIRVEA